MNNRPTGLEDSADGAQVWLPVPSNSLGDPREGDLIDAAGPDRQTYHQLHRQPTEQVHATPKDGTYRSNNSGECQFHSTRTGGTRGYIDVDTSIQVHEALEREFGIDVKDRNVLITDVGQPFTLADLAPRLPVIMDRWIGDWMSVHGGRCYWVITTLSSKQLYWQPWKMA